ncbi:uncharacterized protein V1518DRAFT_231812 [Limtongia smithiae]|uniref:uncharacterized protein n=1 Tax=Limtongia smithiae TaxID=1125753 RepID=UPI0034CFC4E4
MDFTLRCNNHQCRAPLNQQAVVTTCSHIFCAQCANQSFQAGEPKTCPACDAPLNGPEDVVATVLNVSDDYKTSVLSGLSPTVISEVASRALSFWTYQCSHEMTYQDYHMKSLGDKYQKLNQQMDKLVNDANSEISALLERLAAVKKEREMLIKKNAEIADSLHSKNVQYTKLQSLYERLKRKMLFGANQGLNVADASMEQAVFSQKHTLIGDMSYRRPFNPPMTPGDSTPIRQPLANIHNLMHTPKSRENSTSHRLRSVGVRLSGGL